MAQISNVLIRFIWVFYIPESGPDFLLRTFIAAVLEILRRWQWNFCTSPPHLPRVVFRLPTNGLQYSH